jgi:hypothetical protein
MQISRGIAAIGTAATMLALGGCASAPRAQDENAIVEAPGASSAAAPADFWLSVTVAGPNRAGGLPATPRDERPARYIIEPDRQLRAAVGTGASEESFPPAVRRLNDEQIDRLWVIVRDGGFLRPDHPAEPKGLILFDTLPEKTMYVVNVFASGQRRQLLIDGESGDEQTRAAARALAGALAELAWIEPAPAAN